MSESMMLGNSERTATEHQLNGRYIYCIAPVVNILEKGLQGLNGAKVYQIVFRDIGAVVHDCPEVPYQGTDEEVQNWLMTHHNVIETIWQAAGTVLPMTFDVIVKGDETSLADQHVLRWLKEHYADFKTKLANFYEKVELGIRIVWDKAAAIYEITAVDPEIKQLQAEKEKKSKGMAFFYQQKIEKLIAQKANDIAGNISQEYLRKIQALSVETRLNKPKRLLQNEMILNLSVLAEKKQVDKIGELLGELQGQKGIEVQFTGPWPPYSFTMEAAGE